MTITLPRRTQAEVPETGFMRPVDPSNHVMFERVLPWMTPQFVYEMKDQDWIRWIMPKELADKLGISGGCACCGEDNALRDEDGSVYADTAYSETDWWLAANGYAVPGATPAPSSTPAAPIPTEGETS